MIAQKADGVPLFIEELTKALIESGELVEKEGRLELAGVDRIALPATLRDSLSARLDRLGVAKQVAQVAAVLGRTFRLELLAAVADFEEEDLRRLLDQLVSSELVLRKGFGARRRYFFKHALIRDAAYDSLLAGERRRLHGRAADAIETSAVSEPERLAYHLTEAGD